MEETLLNQSDRKDTVTIHKMKTLFLAMLLAALILAGHPFQIQCPRDGHAMYFDHQVGFGKDAVCWYSHVINGQVKHESYISCGD